MKNITLNTFIKMALNHVNSTEGDIYLFLRSRYLYKDTTGLLPTPPMVNMGLFKVVQYRPNKKAFYVTPKGQHELLKEIISVFPTIGFGAGLGAYNG